MLIPCDKESVHNVTFEDAEKSYCCRPEENLEKEECKHRRHCIVGIVNRAISGIYKNLEHCEEGGRVST